MRKRDQDAPALHLLTWPHRFGQEMCLLFNFTERQTGCRYTHPNKTSAGAQSQSELKAGIVILLMIDGFICQFCPCKSTKDELGMISQR